MTRKIQKQEERKILAVYLGLRGLAGDVENGPEPPDFIVRVPGQVLGVEVLEYHLPERTLEGFTPRQVEDAWDCVRDHVRDFREDHPELDGLSVYLEFKSRLVPPRREILPFVKAVAAEVVTVRPQMAEERYTYHKIGAESPAILAKYLKNIRLGEVNCYMEWDWNYNAGGVGTSDQEMLEVLRPKLASYCAPPDVDSSHLVVVGWKGRMSEIIAPLSAEQFTKFGALNAALEAGPFDEVTVMCFTDFLWTRAASWRSLTFEAE